MRGFSTHWNGLARKVLATLLAGGVSLGSFISTPAHGQSPPIGTQAVGLVTVTGSATDIFAATSGGATRYRVKVLNTDYTTVSGGTGYVVWCRWGTAAAAAATVRGTGSFPIFPGSGFDDNGQGVAQGALNCIGETSGAKLYYETYTGGI